MRAGKQNQVPTILQTYYNIRIVSYLVLHNKLGFGGKRIQNLERAVEKYLDDYDSERYPAGFFEQEMRAKGIDVTTVVQEIPQRVRMILTYGSRIPTRVSPKEMTAIRVTMQSFLAISMYALNKDMRISVKKIKEIYLPYIAFNLECLAEKRRLQMKDIALVIADECGYQDHRYADAKRA